MALTTFDGSIEIRPWDKADVQVVIEKRGRDHDDVAAIEVKAEQQGDRIEITVTEPRRDHDGFNLHFQQSIGKADRFGSRRRQSSLPKSGDGSIDIERVAGHVQLRSGDGSIRGRMLGGDVEANTGDGSIKLDGKLTEPARAAPATAASRFTPTPAARPDTDWDIVTGDGSVTLGSAATDSDAELDAHTGDGGIHMRDVTLSNVTGKSGGTACAAASATADSAVRVRTGDGSITFKRVTLNSEALKPEPRI